MSNKENNHCHSFFLIISFRLQVSLMKALVISGGGSKGTFAGGLTEYLLISEKGL
jgi:hypothetical protein